MKPVYAGELQCKCLGMAIEAWDDSGRRVLDQPGDLVCTQPFPCMPVSFYADPGNVAYQKAYFSRFPSVWHHGDFIIESSASGGIVMLGRSDGTLNPSGVRFGSAEIYNILANVPEIEDCLAISYKRLKDTDERLVLFLKLRVPGLDQALVDKVRTLIRSHLSSRHIPSFILQCPDIPVPLLHRLIQVAL